MTEIDFLTKRELPSFSNWLEKHGLTAMADGFAEYNALVADLLAQEEPALGADEQSLLRMMKGIGVATVELCNIEIAAGRSEHQVLRTLARVMGAMAMYNCASAFRSDTPWRVLMRMLVEEFRHGARYAADHLTDTALSPSHTGEER